MKRFFVLTMMFAGFFSLSARAEEVRTVPSDMAAVKFSFAPLVKKVSPSVVNIYTKRVVRTRYSPFASDPLFDYFFGQNMGMGSLTRQRVENALGSGVIVQSDGLIVTNAHVVKDADDITAVLPDGREFEARKILEDEPSDLALLRIDAGDEVLPAVSLGPSENLEVGDLVVAIGNPFGVGQTVTSGIVSALSRSSLSINDFNFFIQTDAAINPGNSGGPLIDMEGNVIGINSAIYSRDGGSLGIGFAVPSEMVATVIAAEKSGLTNEGRGIIRAWLGISAQKVTQDIAESLNLKAPGGVLVSALHPSSPAKKAGLRVGDVVTAVNGKIVHEPAEMKFRMAMVPIGSVAAFDVLRKGAAVKIDVPAQAPPEDPPRQQMQLSGNHPFDGATLANINPAVAAELGLKEDEGVVVADVNPARQAMRVVSPGDVIVNINGADIRNMDQLQSVLRRGASTAWQIVVSRDGKLRRVILR